MLGLERLGISMVIYNWESKSFWNDFAFVFNLHLHTTDSDCGVFLWQRNLHLSCVQWFIWNAMRCIHFIRCWLEIEWIHCTHMPFDRKKDTVFFIQMNDGINASKCIYSTTCVHWFLSTFHCFWLHRVSYRFKSVPSHTHRKTFTNNNLCVHKSMHIAMLLISTLCELTSYWNVYIVHRTPNLFIRFEIHSHLNVDFSNVSFKVSCDSYGISYCVMQLFDAVLWIPVKTCSFVMQHCMWNVHMMHEDQLNRLCQITEFD